MGMSAFASNDGGAGSLSAVSSIGVPASICVPIYQPAAMAAISVFCSGERLPQMALELEDTMMGMVRRGQRERRRTDAAMAGAGV